MKLRRLLYLAPSSLFLGWGCSENGADLGSNLAGSAGDSSNAGQDAAGGDGSSGSSATGAVGGSAAADGGTAGTDPAGGADSGGTSGNPRDGGSAGEPGGNAGDAGSGGTSHCECPYPPVLGGDCCTARDACETEGVDCDELRRSIQVLRGWGADDEDDGPASDCVRAISAALVERCAFVPPECGEPAEQYATFGGHEGGISECTTEETRALLHCDELGSYYGPTCCQRKRCHDDGICPNGRCIYSLTQTPDEFEGGQPHASGCGLLPEGCTCGWIQAAPLHTAYCIGDDEDIARFDCDVQSRTCDELDGWYWTLIDGISFSEVEPSAAAASAYRACADKISLELDDRCTCRTVGCNEGWHCADCLDDSSETYWVCKRDGSTCE